MLDLFNKKALAEAQIKIANAEAKAEANSKKFKTAVIAGSSTTGAAVAAIAAHFVFGNGRKLNRDKIKNFDSVVEERDTAIGERNEAVSKVEGLNNKVKALENTVETVTASGYNLIEANGKLIDEGDLNAWNKAVEAHENITAKVFGTRTPEDLDKLRANLRKSFETTLKELEKADQNTQQTQVQPQEQPQPQVQPQSQVQQEQPQPQPQVQQEQQEQPQEQPQTK